MREYDSKCVHLYSIASKPVPLVVSLCNEVNMPYFAR